MYSSVVNVEFELRDQIVDLSLTNIHLLKTSAKIGRKDSE